MYFFCSISISNLFDYLHYILFNFIVEIEESVYAPENVEIGHQVDSPSKSMLFLF